MNRQIRKSILSDAESFIEIKNQLSFKTENNESISGGFLLGTDLDTYKEFIKNSYCLTALVNRNIIGFGIAFNNKTLRNSEIWEKRKSASWHIDLLKLEQENIAYFEQLAFVKGHKLLAIQLAYNLVRIGFNKGASTFMTTTVNKPIKNLAAVPFINASKGILAGNINEFYPIIGEINSDIYMIKKEDFYKELEKVSYKDLLIKSHINY